jgi:hypothetical protein
MFNWLDKYFTFTRTERMAVVALVLLSALVLIAPKVYFFLYPVKHVDDAARIQQIETFITRNRPAAAPADTVGKIIPDSTAWAVLNADTSGHLGITKAKPAKGYFQFDPNKIGVDDWVKLGFTEKQAQSIEKYKSKGGKFYKASDLMRLYAMDEEHYLKLVPYVKIDVDALPKRNYNRY